MSDGFHSQSVSSATVYDFFMSACIIYYQNFQVDSRYVCDLNQLRPNFLLYVEFTKHDKGLRA